MSEEAINPLISVHVGLFGHIDSGKTAIAAVLSEVISTAGIDAHPQSKERGITIDLGFTSFTLKNYLVTLVDGPGHADLIRISASSVEIIDCAIIVIDINKGPQIQTGEHIIMIESLGITKLVVILNKTDIFKGNVQEEIKKTRKFFDSTAFGRNLPIYPVSAKNEEGFGEVKAGLLSLFQSLRITRDIEGKLIIPIDHHFSIKGRGAVLTGTIISGSISLNETLYIIPGNMKGRVKNIQTFHQDIKTAKAGDRVGINLKDVDVKNISRGSFLTTTPEVFSTSEVLDVYINNNNLFKKDTLFGTQVHITIGMTTISGEIFPYDQVDGKRVRKDIKAGEIGFNAIIMLYEKAIIPKRDSKLLISRLDLPPTTLRILGSADLISILQKPPLFYRYKAKMGKVANPNHSQGIICSGLAQSLEGAKKLVNKKLNPPFSKVVGAFGTKGLVIVSLLGEATELNKGDIVRYQELRSFRLKSKKHLNF